MSERPRCLVVMDDFGAMPDDEAIATAVSSVLTLFGVQNLKPLQVLSLRLLVRRRDGTSSRAFLRALESR